VFLGVFWSLFTFRGCFKDLSDFRGILVILEVLENFFKFILEVLGLFWSFWGFYVFWSIYGFQNSKFQILPCINGSKQEILKSMDLKSRHFKSIDLKSKSKSKSKYPNATYMFFDKFQNAKELGIIL
jgi:hypothetical protein